MAWQRLQDALAQGDRWIARLHLPAMRPATERWFGADGAFWTALLAVLPVVYIGFSLTVGVHAWGAPQYLYPWIDNDYWWHLAAGDWMIDTRSMPSPDPWLFTYDGKFIAHEWLGEVFLAATDRSGGYAGSIIATWVIAIAGFWMLMHAAHLYGLSWRGCAIVSLLWLGVFLRDGVIAVRPQMWTFSLYALLFLILAAYETRRLSHLWLLPPLFLVWFNTHLSAVIGIGILGCFGLDRMLRGESIRHPLIVGVLCLAGIIVNPFGLEFVEPIFRFTGRPESWNREIYEWMAPDFSHPHNWPFALAIPLVILAAGQLLRGRVWPALLVPIFLQQGLTSVRFITVYVIFCVVFWAWLVGRNRGAGDALPAQKPARWPAVLTTIVAALVVLGIAATSPYSQLQQRPVAWGYPVTAATLYQEKFADLRLYNTYDWGGYLIHRFRGKPQIYIDGRADTYPVELFERFNWIAYGSAGWDRMLEEDRIGALMIRSTDTLNDQLAEHPDWKLAFMSEESTLYVRSEFHDRIQPR